MRLTTKGKYPHGAEGRSQDRLTGKYCRGVFEATAIVEKLAEYEDAEEEGLLLRPSCKVGDTVYRINIGARKPIIPLRVVEVRFKVVGNYIREKICCSDDFMSKTASCIYCKEDIGTKVFLCKSEAEQKLLHYTLYKEGRNDKRSKTKHEKHV